MGQHKSQRDGGDPIEKGIKQEGDQRLSAGAQHKINRVDVSIQRHKCGADADKTCCQLPNGIRGIVDTGEQRAHQEKHGAYAHADQHREDRKPCGVLTRLPDLSRAKGLPQQNGDGIAHGDERYIKDIGDSLRDVQRCHCGKPAHRITLHQRGHTGSPQGLVRHQRNGFAHHAARKPGRHLPHPAPGTNGKGIDFRVNMCPARHECKFHKTGDHRGRRSTRNAQRRGSELSVDQHIIPDQIDHHRQDAGLHGNHRLPGIAQRCGIHLRQTKGQQSRVHDRQITLCLMQGLRHTSTSAVLVQEEHDQGISLP